MPKSAKPERATPPRRLVTLILDRERHLLYEFDTLEEMDKTFKINTFAGGPFAGDLSISRLKAVIWYGLRHEDPDLTLARVGKLLTADRIQELADAVMLAWGKDPAKTRKAAEKKMAEDDQDEEAGADPSLTPKSELPG